jgi:ATP-binding cassette subfamily C protein
VASAVLFGLFANLLLFTGPVFMLQVYDRVLATRSMETLVALFALVTLLLLLYGLLEHARRRTMAAAAARLLARLHPPVVRAALRPGAAGPPLPQVLKHLESLHRHLSTPSALALHDLPWVPLFIAGIFLFHPLLGWLAVAGGALLVLAAGLSHRLTRRGGAQAGAARAEVAALAARAEEASALPGLSASLSEALQAGLARGLRLGHRAGGTSEGLASFSRALRHFLQSAMLALGAALALRGEISAGAIIAASVLMGRALSPIEQIILHWPILREARAARKALGRLLAAAGPETAPLALPEPAGRLSASGLSLRYREGAEPALQDVGFEVKPGTALGVLGHSGSGKTTLARLLSGGLAPSGGKLLLDGMALAGYPPQELAQRVGCLPQRPVWLNGTIARNIAAMAPAPAPKEVVLAARRAGIHADILRLPAGYNTPLGNSGAPLPGGFLQRLALARALYRAPALLVLDEPGAGLDFEGIQALNAVIRAHKAARGTVVVMSQQPAVLSECDDFLLLHHGRIARRGPLHEVVAAPAAPAAKARGP